MKAKHIYIYINIKQYREKMQAHYLNSVCNTHMKVRSFVERKEFIRRRGGRRQGNGVKRTKRQDLRVWNWIVCSSPDSSQQHRYLSVAALHNQPLEIWTHVQNARILVASYRYMHPINSYTPLRERRGVWSLWGLALSLRVYLLWKPCRDQNDQQLKND